MMHDEEEVIVYNSIDYFLSSVINIVLQWPPGPLSKDQLCVYGGFVSFPFSIPSPANHLDN